MLVWHNHHVTRGVGIGIKDDKAMFSAVNDAALFVVLRLGAIAEDTAAGLLAAGDIGVAPRRPDVIHGRDSLTFGSDFGDLRILRLTSRECGRQSGKICMKRACRWFDTFCRALL